MSIGGESRKNAIGTRLLLVPKVGRTLLRHPRASNLPRRRFLRLAVGAAALPATAPDANAQTYPVRPITMIVPSAAGSFNDVVGRVVAERMRGSLGQPIIIENVSGADGSIGTGRAARARPDGYTINLGFTGTNVLNGAFYSLPYDLMNGFEPISPLVTTAFAIFTRKAIPAKDLREFIAWLKANPDKASAAIASPAIRLLTALFQKETGTHFTLVPYRVSITAIQDLVAGRIDLSFGTADQLPLMRASGVKAYGVTSDTRLSLAPDVPTFGEMGLPAVSFPAWGGLFAPRGTPRDIIGKLNAAAMDALADPAVRSHLVDLGTGIFPREQQTPEVLATLVKSDAEKWWPIIKELGIKGNQ